MNKAEAIALLKEIGHWDRIVAAYTALKADADKGGFDWNPFDKDEDEFGLVGEIQNNVRLVKGVVNEVVVGVEAIAARIADEGEDLMKSEDKLDAAATLVANMVKKVLPFWLFFAKPAVKPVVVHFITEAVERLNEKLGKDWLDKLPAADVTPEG